MQPLVEWLDQWQTLVGSFLGALGGAAAAIVAVFMSRWFRELNAARYLQAELKRLETAYTSSKRTQLEPLDHGQA